MNRNRQTPELSTVGMLNDVSICRNDDLESGGELASSNHNVNIILHVAYRCQALSRWLGSSQQIISNCFTESVSLSAEHRTSRNHQPLCSFPTIFSLNVTNLRGSLSLFRVNIFSAKVSKQISTNSPIEPIISNSDPNIIKVKFKASKSHILSGLGSISGLSWEVWLELRASGNSGNSANHHFGQVGSYLHLHVRSSMEPLVMDLFAQPLIDSLPSIFPSIRGMCTIEINRVIKYHVKANSGILDMRMYSIYE